MANETTSKPMAQGRHCQRPFLVQCHGLGSQALFFEVIVPNENSVQPMADVIPQANCEPLKQFEGRIESGERNPRRDVCASERSRTQISKGEPK